MRLSYLIIFYAVSLCVFLATRRAERSVFRWIDKTVLFLALLTHLGFIVLRGVEARRFPLTDTYETLLVFAWMTALMGSMLFCRYKIVGIRVFSDLVTISILIFSVFLSADIQPLMPSLRSSWLIIHVVAYFIAYASFAIGFGVSLIFLVLSIRKNKGKDFEEFLDRLEGIIFRVIDLGFPFLTVGITCGAIWASISWGRFWSWDAKEVWALVTWLIYAGCLHLRHTRELTGRYAAILAALGFIAVIFTYIGVNLLFPATIHSYS